MRLPVYSMIQLNKGPHNTVVYSSQVLIRTCTVLHLVGCVAPVGFELATFRFLSCVTLPLHHWTMHFCKYTITRVVFFRKIPETYEFYEEIWLKSFVRFIWPYDNFWPLTRIPWNRSYFNKFRVSKKKLKPQNFKKLINIQEVPSYG